ncbi:MAG: class B sortase [Lachnospiraceae bacterium]|jgi:sortase B|nr:class B sortase [Lachnospiraceae bacterium]
MNRKNRKRGSFRIPIYVLLAALAADGCGNGGGENPGVEENLQTDGWEDTTGIAHETAADGHVDFDALQEENPDIFAWLYVPGAGIDLPVLQSPVSDDFYKTHGADGEEDMGGALYTEMPNMMDMCDFNTIIHGKDEGEEDLFAGLHRFEDPDFFEENEKFYIYLKDNVLTYEVFAAYYDDGSDILRRFDYTTYKGCESWLEEVYGIRDMGKRQREGWEDLTPWHFFVTLDGSVGGESGKQYVVIGVLTGDAAGQIDRVILN